MTMTTPRDAIINRLKDTVAGLGGRAYQAMGSHGNKVVPFATVKLPGATGDGRVAFAGAQRVEVRIYDQGGFSILDTLEAAVIQALNGQTIQGYYVQHDPGGGDFEEEGKLGRIMFFEIAALWPPH